MKILLVEDSATLRFTMSSIIKSAGHDVVVVESGEEALQLVENVAVDLVIMDVEMPGLNGFETTRLMRETFGKQWVPIIFITGMSDDKSFLEGIDAGGDDYMIKPVSPVILKAKIRALERITDMQQELTRLNRELKSLSQRDGLTGLYNRRAFEQMAEQQWKIQTRAREPIGVLMIDVDHFKPYNDHYGHQAGDRCLQQVAIALQNALHRPADVVARYGGEEFIVLLPNTDQEGCGVVAKTLCESVATLQIVHDRADTATVVTVSVGGAATKVASGVAMHDLIKQADSALYSAKNQGRNRAVVEAMASLKTVLVVDDDATALKVISGQLRNSCNLLTANNGDDCIELAYNVRPDLILLDILLPGMDGLAVCRQLKESAQTASIPIILISAEGGETQLALSKQVNANGCLEKPIDEAQLLAKVGQFLNQPLANH